MVKVQKMEGVEKPKRDLKSTKKFKSLFFVPNDSITFKTPQDMVINRFQAVFCKNIWGKICHFRPKMAKNDTKFEFSQKGPDRFSYPFGILSPYIWRALWRIAWSLPPFLINVRTFDF